MSEYVTTNIRLPRDTLRSLKLLAVEEEKSVSQLIRECVNSRLGPSGRSGDEFEADPFFEAGPLGPGGKKRGSEDHDKLLYGSRGKGKKIR